MRTIIEIPEGFFVLRRNYYRRFEWLQSCSLCAIKKEGGSGCEFCTMCSDYDTEDYSVYLQRLELAKPSNPLKHPKRSAEEGSES